MGSLNSLRSLVNLAVLQMRFDLQTHNPRAINDFFDAMTLSRNIARQPILVTTLVAIGSEATAIKWFAHDLPSLPKINSEEFKVTFEKLPQTTLAELLAGETKYATEEADRQGGIMPIMVQGLDPSIKRSVTPETFRRTNLPKS